ncbi:plasmid stabilization protein [Peptococcaceae bacterium SCADC1_2_3]|jgi:addiction module RelE/StbE family toxin|nr:plasmid stabilization protein [Peptococcaceae bacterium SCADC1_2_3]KFI35530.1 plasmid stabilization protein [Peptococcaceae bacterium SCADC1_2_3]KFI35922.1 plasmid stabilization protein [Peptococcaceae bacterium SCADC1_2_3]HBQ28284.1 type II toxin-antitoxin system RelE/ParE family toxin [Desulfotomaculum sp.]HCJ79266.1 type II toxin-antitoxin system RelE/ParE family toxin [Desulfotomaculum sp.]
MKQYKVLMTEPAADDLQETARYISKELREPAVALKLVEKIKETVMSLADMPARHALVADERLTVQGIRKLTVENYIVFYVVSEEDMAVTVVRILCGRRDWINLL